MAKFIRDPRSPQYPAPSHIVLEMLGVKRLPDEGMPPRKIQDIEVFVAAKLPRDHRHMQKIRVMAICECGQILAASRLQQHRCKESK